MSSPEWDFVDLGWIRLAEKIGAGDFHFLHTPFHRRVRPPTKREGVQALRLARRPASAYTQLAQK